MSLKYVLLLATCFSPTGPSSGNEDKNSFSIKLTYLEHLSECTLEENSKFHDHLF
jgi:hypothetical protein